MSQERDATSTDNEMLDTEPNKCCGFVIPISCFLSIFAGLVIIMIPLTDFRPLLDGNVYLSCISSAVSQPFNIFNFRCVDHISIAYILLLSISQYIIPHSNPLIFVTNILLATCTSAALYGILRILTRSGHFETCLATAIFAFSPVYVANIFEATLDFGLVSFFTIYIFFLLKRSYLVACLFAVAMSFTKETGIVLYLGSTFIYFWMFLIKNGLCWNEKIKAMRRAAILIIPIVLLIIYYLLLAREVPPDKLFWQAGKINLIHIALNFRLTSGPMLAYFANLFVLNFSWIFTISLLLLIFFAPRRIRLIIPVTRRAYVYFFLWNFIFSLYLITRVDFFFSNIPRYVLVAYVLLFILFYHIQNIIIASARWRLSLLCSILLLILTSNFRTIDPISKQIYGTYAFGKHQVLNMSRFIGINGDAFVYNLEFTKLFYLVNVMAQDMHIANDSLVFIGDQYIWWPVRVENNGISTKYSIKLINDIKDMNPEILVKKYHNPDSFFFIDFPNFNNTKNLNYLLKNYKMINVKMYDIDGYHLIGYVFQIR